MKEEFIPYCPELATLPTESKFRVIWLNSFGNLSAQTVGML